MWYKHTPGVDQDYEQSMKQLTLSQLMVNYLYSDTKGTSVAGVTLHSDIQKLYRMWTPPHISLFKDKHSYWKDLGKVVREGQNANDWVVTSANTWTSADTGLTRRALFWTVQVTGNIHLQPEEQ